MSSKVQFIRECDTKKKPTVLKLAKKEGIKIKAPCNGKGKCGKCLVRILDGNVSDPSKAEQKLLSKKQLEQGYRLACETEILGDSKIILED